MAAQSIPSRCTVLVVGGGPGGSYTASVLGREGIDTVLLESDTMPRYHIGETMLPSFRHYLKFIDLDSEFDSKGFTKKLGAAFKMSPRNREGYTDFLAAGGPDNYSWNVIRSEADEMLFRHAAKSGANTFEGVKVTSISFQAPLSVNGNAAEFGDYPGRPVSASWSRKGDGATGSIEFDYVVDATGRNGLINTKYLKNRHYNKSLKNVANWAYFKGAGKYGKGSSRENSPLFEALRDESGWAWFIPLHDGTHSIGLVMNQEVATKHKAASGSTAQFYKDSLKLAPMLCELLGDAEQITGVKSASDYSYHSSSYSFPYARIVGDAGCFIDPFFSSGVHLAATGGLAAGTSIAASLRGDVSEARAAKWHSNKIREGYSRFLLVVLGAYKQMRNQTKDVLTDFGEDNFDRAFSFFKPVIQGTADATAKLTQAEFAKTVDFMSSAFQPVLNPDGSKAAGDMTEDLSEEYRKAIQGLRAYHSKDGVGMENWTTDVVDGLVPKLERGGLTLVPATARA
ncbi:hypothetical protein GGR56DRAFT_697116 [Xylariaceae sp. FL0804]|nr:hypothetical protein GGR56DRAFT_697116 [Xylariaceae sp. FL0804]